MLSLELVIVFRRPMTFLGLPLGSILVLGIVVVLPVLAYVLYRIDRARGEGYVTVFGYRGTDTE